MAGNPLFNANRLKLGIFGTNGKGSAQTLVPEAYRPSWPAALQTAQMADAAGYEAIVAYARWKGYLPDKPAHPSGVVLEPFTFAAGLAQATRYSAVFATSHAPTLHPVAAAKMAATVDIIAGGRFGLNIVGGWNKPELEMFGAPLREHDERYEHLAEWLEVIERLWREEREFDFAGRFFTLSGAASMPKPLQRPRPAIMNAGGSTVGMRFACQHADMCFVILRSEDLEEAARQITTYKTTARKEFGREVQVWTYVYVVQRDTVAEAEAYLQHYAVTQEDSESLDAWNKGLGEQTKVVSPEGMAAFRKRFAAGGGGSGLVGTAETIAARLHALSDAGLDGALLTWVDFADGMARFNRDVLPLLEARGLRAPFGPA